MSTTQRQVLVQQVSLTQKNIRELQTSAHFPFIFGLKCQFFNFEMYVR